MRRFVAIEVLLALGPAVLAAPFLHLHGHEHTDHFISAHRARTLVAHTHFSTPGGGASHKGTAVVTAGRDDDDAIFLNWFQDNPHPAPSPELLLAEIPAVPVPEPRAAWSDVPIHCSHDPPFLFSISPRSPPARSLSWLGA